jgi:hypothetical protein
MAEYTLDLDAGTTEEGPFLTWYAAGSKDGTIPAGTFAIRENRVATAISLATGIVFDWPGSRTGWMQSTGAAGVAPRKQWNASRTSMERQPADDWKKAFRVQLAYLGNGQQPVRAVWEQSSTASWIAFVAVMGLLRNDATVQLPKLPLLACSGHHPHKFGGGMTLIPDFKLVQYVARPACLPEEDAAPAPSPATAWGAPQPRPTGVNGGTAPAAIALPATPAAPVDTKLVDDEIPF